MSHENESYIRFSLEESIRFRKGQEVAELLSISLEPEITIQENDQYAIIRGSLYLSGEYEQVDSGLVDEESFSTSAFMQFIEVNEDGKCDFNHRFPIDITIPTSRLNSIYDVNVEIESFDYALHDPNCLKLTADLSIGGLLGDEEGADEEREQPTDVDVLESEAVTSVREEINLEAEEISDDEEEMVEHTPSDEEMEPFVVEARKQPAELEQSNYELPTFDMSQQIIHIPAVDEEEISVHDKIKSSGDEHAAMYEAFPEDTVAPLNNELEVSFSSYGVRSEGGLESSSSYLDESSSESSNMLMDDESESSSEQVEEKKKKPKKKKWKKNETLTLTEFFSRKDEGEKTKMKVCIVQKGQTLHDLVEKYGVNEQRILRVNEIEQTNELFEGQVLYIPAVDGRRA